MTNDLQLYIHSFQTVAIVTLHAVIAIVATVVSVHLIGVVYFHYVNSTHPSTERHYYCFTSTPTQDGRHEHLPLPVMTDESDCDSDDGFKQDVSSSRCVNKVHWGEAQTLPYNRQKVQVPQQYRTSTLPSQYHMRAQRHPDQAAMLQSAYSETKV